MKNQICVMRDGAKRYSILFVNSVPIKEMWTGDDKGWIDIKDEHKHITVDECVSSKYFSHMRQTDGYINPMLRSLERNEGATIEGYNPKEDTITLSL